MSSRPREKFRRLLEEVALMPPTPTAVEHPCDASSLAGAVDAAIAGIITPILVGPPNKVFAVARTACIDITPY